MFWCGDQMYIAHQNMRMSLRFVLLTLILLIVDFSIFLVLAVALMDYDDSYTGPTEEYFSLTSMTRQQRVFWISYQGWWALNILAGVFLIARFAVRVKRNNRKE